MLTTLLNWFSTLTTALLRATRDSRLQVRVFEVTDDDGATVKNPSVDLVILHGLGGDPWDTWSADGKPSTWWPKEVRKNFPNVRVLVCYYPTQVRVTDSAPNIPTKNRATRLAQILLTTLQCGPRPLVFVAHSLGGLHVKHLAEEARALAYAVDTYLFVAVPHKGASLANLASLFGGAGRDVRALRSTGLRGELVELHRRFFDVVAEARAVGRASRVLGMYESLPVLGDEFVVSQDEAMDRMDNSEDMLEAQTAGNHMTCVRPADPAQDPFCTAVAAALSRATQSTRDAETSSGASGPGVTAYDLLDPNRRKRYFYDGQWHAAPSAVSPFRAFAVATSIAASLLAILVSGVGCLTAAVPIVAPPSTEAEIQFAVPRDRDSGDEDSATDARARCGADDQSVGAVCVRALAPAFHPEDEQLTCPEGYSVATSGAVPTGFIIPENAIVQNAEGERALYVDGGWAPRGHTPLQGSLICIGN